MTPPTPLQTRPHLRKVEQISYKCGNVQKGWVTLPPISFKVGGVEGIKLTDAMNLRFNGPDDRDELMFTGGSVGKSISCRIQVRGFNDDDFHYH